MADRTKVRNQMKGLFDSNPNVSNALLEANMVFSQRAIRSQLVNINLNATNVILDEISNFDWSDNVEVVGIELLPGVAINTTDAGTVINVWKMNTIGAAKTLIGQVNTAAMSANVNAFESVANTNLNLSNATVLRGGCIGFDVTQTGAGVSNGVTSMIRVTVRGV